MRALLRRILPSRAASGAAARGGAVGGIDQVADDAVRGWAYDPQGRHRDETRLLINGAAEIPLEPGIDRPDVRDSGAAGAADVGFELLFGSLDGVTRARIAAALTDGAQHIALQVAGRTVAEMSAPLDRRAITHGLQTARRREAGDEAGPEAVGMIDIVDRFGISGWVFASDGGHRDRARIVIDGRIDLPLAPDRQRRDVAASGAAAADDAGFELLFADLDEETRARLEALFDGAELGVDLYVGETRVASMVAPLNDGLAVAIRAAGPGAAEGWVTAPTAPRRPLMVELSLDGHALCAEPLTRVDAALAQAEGAGWAARFSIRVPCAVNGGSGAVGARVPGALGRPEASVTLDLPPRAERSAAVAAIRAAEAERRARGVAVVIPIHNAPDALEACLESVVRHTTAPARLILVDDASTDPRIGGILARAADDPAVTVLHNRLNRGFAASVNRALSQIEGADAVLLNSDARVGPRWLENLAAAAYGAADIGTATAVSDNAGAFTAPVPDIAREEEPALARAAARASALLWPETPTGSGFCMYVRADCLAATGLFDEDAFPRGYGEENDFCMRAMARGWRHVVDERTLAFHERGASFGAERESLLAQGQERLRARHPDYPARVAAFLNSPSRAVANARIAAHADPAAGARPRVLFVISTSGGGTPMTNRDLMGGLQDRYETFLLQCDSRRISLYAGTGDDAALLESHELAERIQPAGHRSAEYESVVGQWLAAHAIELVHVRHIAWHSLGLTELARALDIPVVFSFHDFYAVCPTVKLLDENLVYCGGTCTAPGAADCQADLWTGAQIPPLKHAWIHPWRAAAARMLAACDAFVTTSETAREVIGRNFPDLAKTPFRVIPHGRDFAGFRAPEAPEIAPGGPIRVLVPGKLSPAKGVDLVRRVKALDAAGRVEFHILGDAEGYLNGVDVIEHGPYEREDFARRVADIRPHIGAVLSLWPETFCHTLTELWAAGLPVVGLDIGAVGERIGTEGPGWLVPPDAPDLPGAVLAAILAAADDPAALQAAMDGVRSWQETAGRERNVAWMAEAYADLYAETLAARRPFGAMLAP